jgi:hypothetical protein
MASKKKNQQVAEICLYGTSAVGSGYIARAASGEMIGNGVLVPGRSFTEAVWIAVDELEAAGLRKPGTIAIFAPGGEQMAVTDAMRVPAFGDLKWQRAPVYVLTMETGR